jgi:ABC-type branched-subunit amino acid transport system substrate-binding protein
MRANNTCEIINLAKMRGFEKNRGLARIFSAMACVGFAWVAFENHSAFAEGPPSAAAGKLIYRTGQDPGGSEISALPLGRSSAAPARNFPCANCHGLRGEGREEGALATPPVDWRSLTSARAASANWSARPAFEAEGVKRAILSGTSVSGAPLAAAMPHYVMNERQIDSVISYLKLIGSNEDMDVGIGVDFIKLGAVLPLTGAMAAQGAQTESLLRRYFTEINERGGVYRRKILLEIADSKSEESEASRAVRRLVEDGVFALVAVSAPLDPATRALIMEAQIPLLGPLNETPRESDRRDAYIWRLRPSFADQGGALADYIISTAEARKPSLLRVAIIYEDEPGAREAMSGARTRLIRGAANVLERSYTEIGRGTSAIVSRPAELDWIIFLGKGSDLDVLVLRLQALGDQLPSIGALAPLSADARNFADFHDAKIVYAMPHGWNFIPLADGQKKEGGNFNIARIERDDALIALAAAKLTVETLARVGIKLSRDQFSSELEKINNLETGVLPPISFGKNSHIGVSNTRIVVQRPNL